MISEWKILTDTKSERGAKVLANRIMKKLGIQLDEISFQNYWKDDTIEICFNISSTDMERGDFIVHLIGLVQALGANTFQIDSDIHERFDLTCSSEIRMPGLRMISVISDKGGHYE